MASAGARIFACWVLAACTACTLAPSTSATNTYVLDEAEVRKACKPAESPGEAAGSLVVSVPRARPGFDSPRMAYVQRSYTLEFFAHSRWVDAPPRLLGPLIVSCLGQTGGFQAVALGPTGVAADWRLDADIEYLQQEFTESSSRVRVGLRIQVVDLGRGAILGQRYFERVAPAPSDDPYGGVVATNQALGAVLAEVAQWTVSLTRAARP
jgi:cholesterol transport system auxiliary component